MPEKRTLERAKADLKAGKSPSTAAGEFVRQEIDHIRAGKHGARSAKQAIAIGLSEARRAGIPLKPKPGAKGPAPKAKARRAAKAKAPSRARSVAAEKALEKEPHSAASHRALSAHARKAAAARAKRGASKR